MRVGMDVSPLVQTRAGTARYVEHLLEHLPWIERLGFGGPGAVSTLARDAWWYPVGLPLAARGLDVLHCPTFRAPLRPPVPLVMTVLDLAVLRHPETFTQWTRRYSRLFVPRVARAARLIVAISEFTKRELVELLGVPASKIRVTPLGVAPVFAPEGPAAPGDYLLAVGTLEP